MTLATSSPLHGRSSLVWPFAVMLLGIWCSTGTLAPYAATLDPAWVRVREPCGYLVNIDHDTHRTPFLMLAGAPREQWDWGVTLRRVLYTIVAYPLVKEFGYDVGGLIANVLLTLAGVAGFVAYTDRRYGARPARAAAWLLATYPGIAYWVGLPYSYAIIVPACLGLLVVFLELAEEERAGRVFGLALAAGVLFTGYDLMIFFGPAAVLMFARRHRPTLLAVACIGFAAPYLFVQTVLWSRFGVPWSNTNTAVYDNVFRAYLDWRHSTGWMLRFQEIPRTLYQVFLGSNFVFLPLLFLLLLAGTRRPIGVVGGAILLASFAIFLFNELAPPYPGFWQIRGPWIARLYQPVFCSFLLYAIHVEKWRWTAGGERARWVGAAIALCTAANAAVVFGPIVPVRPLTSFAGTVYWAFYRHSDDGSFLANIDRYGRRPLGFCRHLP